jgi:hypothetical protein
MESRMMLSAAAPTLEVSLPVAPNEAGGDQQIFTAMQVLMTSPVNEGGFVLNGTVIPSGTDYFSYRDDSPTIPDLIGSDSTFGSFDESGVVGNGELFGTGGLVVRAVDFSSPSRLSAAIRPANQLTVAATLEGGWITIRPILDSEGRTVESEVEKSLATMGSAKTSLLAKVDEAESSGADESLREISGEWARAVVFEIAGGEPAAESLAFKEPQVKFVPVSSPSSGSEAAETSASTEAALEAERPNARDAASQTRARNRAVDDVSNVRSSHPVSDVSLREAFEHGDLMAQSQLGIALFDRASRAGTVANPSALATDDVLAAAFDEIGDEELTVAAPASDYLRLNSWLSGTPLLLIFALERATARRSRGRQASAAEEDSRRRRIH